MNFSQSTDWLFLCRKSAYHKGICKTLIFYPSLGPGRDPRLQKGSKMKKTEKAMYEN